jgi:hypothetical protein
MTRPITLLSLGAGVQSSTIALMAARGDLPMPDGAVFADTQDEPAPVYRWLDWLETQLPFPVYRVTAGSLEQSVRTKHTSKKGVSYYKTAIPFFTKSPDGTAGKIRHRTCTRDFKIVPIIKAARQHVGHGTVRKWQRTYRSELTEIKNYEIREAERARAKKQRRDIPRSLPYPADAIATTQGNALVVQWVGISLDEMTRMKPSRDAWIRVSWPLIHKRMTRRSCLEWMKSNGYPDPPRSACVYCPFRSDAEWRWLRDNDPEGFARAVLFDHETREMRKGQENPTSETYIHRSLIPLGQVDLRSDTERGQLTLWDDECAGVCGV